MARLEFLFLISLSICQYSRAHSIGTVDDVLQEGFYWRDYLRGEAAPADAWVAGKWNNGTKFYVGQRANHYFGIFPVQITPGDSVNTTDVASSKGLKILCSFRSSHLKWVDTTAKTFNVDMINYYAVPGGVQTFEEKDGHVILFVGKTEDENENESAIGTIWERDAEDTIMRYLSMDGKTVKPAGEYFQVLVHDPFAH